MSERQAIMAGIGILAAIARIDGELRRARIEECDVDAHLPMIDRPWRATGTRW